MSTINEGKQSVEEVKKAAENEHLSEELRR